MTPPDTSMWWTNRRRIAYLSVLGLFVLIGAAMHMPAEQMSGASPLLVAIAWMFGGIIFSYVAAATAEDIVKLRGGPK
jgi:hypothetical protein